MPKPIEKALAEARNPQTESDRLEQLSHWKRRNERSRLRQAIANNPNCEEWLLLKLAAEYPKEVINNPRLQLLQLSEERWWDDCEPLSLLMLLVELGSNAALQMRRDFFNKLASALISTDPLPINKECHMSFSHEVAIEWNPDSSESDSEDDGDKKGEQEVCQEGNEQDLSIKFSCVVEENLYFLKPPYALDNIVGLLEALIGVNSSADLLAVLEMYGWEEEGDSTPGGQGYWEIESVTPALEGWEVEADLLGDGSGTIKVTDPAGETHDIEVEAPCDHGDEYLNPTLDENPDLIASIFESTDKSSPEMGNLLLKIITGEMHGREDEAKQSIDVASSDLALTKKASVELNQSDINAILFSLHSLSDEDEYVLSEGYDADVYSLRDKLKKILVDMQ